MEASTVVCSAILLNILLFYINKYFKGINSARYTNFLETYSLEIGFMNVKWVTSIFNRHINKWVSKKLYLLNSWFNIGVIVALLMIIPSLLLLASTALVSFENVWSYRKEESVLQPVLPGINLPKSDLPYYLLTILISTVLHEMGHAVAAVNDQVPLISFGLMIWVLMPAAFVELPTNSVNSLPPWKKLKIYCAGVWHNVVLSALAFLTFALLPYIMFPLFRSGVGVYVDNLNQYLTGGHHDFQIGDHITHINDCDVMDVNDWTRCLTITLHDPPSGFCVDDVFLSTVDSDAGETTHCCQDSTLSQSHLCFVSSNVKSTPNRKQYCLRARTVSNAASSRCTNNSCSSNQSCLTPSFNQKPSNDTEPLLIVVKRFGSDSILFLGQPDEVHASVHVSNYIPRTFIDPIFVHSIDHMLRYIFSFSAGLAVLNIIPCLFMDGQHIVNALIEAVENRQRFLIQKLLRMSVYLGTFLVAVNVVLGVLLLCL